MAKIRFLKGWSLSRRREFLRILTHALRGPLVGVNGYLDFTLKGYCGPLSGKQRKALSSAREAGLKLQQVLGDFSDLMSLELALVSPRKWKADLVGTLQKSLAKYSGWADSLGLRLETGATHDRKVFLRGDEQQLAQGLDRFFSLFLTGGRRGDRAVLVLRGLRGGGAKLTLSYQGKEGLPPRWEDYLALKPAAVSRIHPLGFLLLEETADLNGWKLWKKKVSPAAASVTVVFP